MKPEDRERKIGELYRDMLREHMESLDLRREKEAFIHRHFESHPPMIFSARAWVPALAAGMIFLVVGIVRMLPPQVQLENRPTGQYTAADAISGSVQVQPPSAEVVRKPVQVKSLSSDVGPTMVYRKIVDDVPITVVWVFPVGG